MGSLLVLLFLKHHVIGGHAQGGQNVLVHTLWRGRSLIFLYNLQITDSVGGGQNAKFVILREMLLRAPSRCVPVSEVQ